jgi:hypothetical protein
MGVGVPHGKVFQSAGNYVASSSGTGSRGDTSDIDLALDHDAWG